MAQLGNVYSIRFRPMGEPDADYRLLGSLDDAGCDLRQQAVEAFNSVDYRVTVEGVDDLQSEVAFERIVPTAADDDVGAMFCHYRFGDRGVLNRTTEQEAVPFTEIDNQQVEVGALLKAPPGQTRAFLALHLANGRGIKRGLEKELKRYFRDNLDLYMETQPVFPLQAVEAALAQHGTRRVTFRKLNNPAGMFDNEADWWAEGADLGEADFSLRPSRNARLLGSRVVGFIRTHLGLLDDDEEPTEFTDVATFDGKEFDEVTVEVLIGGRPKTVYVRLDGYDMSHAFSWELELPAAPNDEQIMQALSVIAHP